MASSAIETQGIMFSWNGELVGKIISFTGPGGSANVIDTTSLESSAKQKMMGLPDEGQFTFEVNLIPDDAGQIELRQDRAARALGECILMLTDDDNTALEFKAYCLGFSISGSVDNVVRASITLEITGDVDWTVYVP